MIVVIGHYPEYVELAAANGWDHFQVDRSTWDSWAVVQQWAANQAYLDRAAANGAVFRLATPPSQARSGSWYERELRYLANLGFRPQFNGTHWELVR